MHANAETLQRFYRAFQNKDADIMAACYASDACFSDPVFPNLTGQEIGDMWRMLTANAQDFSLEFDSVQADANSGSAHWVAHYRFSKTGRHVINDIQANFVFRDGKILRHTDHFSLWRWSRQALGLQGWLLGWSPLVANAVRHQAGRSLNQFRGGHKRN